MRLEASYSPVVDCMVVPKSITFSCPNNSSQAWHLETAEFDLATLLSCVFLFVWAGRRQGFKKIWVEKGGSR